MAEPVYAKELKPGWMDFGWSARKDGATPLEHDVSGYGGWILAREAPTYRPGSLRFRYRAPASHGDFLEVGLDLGQTNNFAKYPRVRPTDAHRRALPNGWVEVTVPMGELNPKRAQFDRIVFFSYKSVPKGWVAFDDIAFLGETKSAAQAAAPVPGQFRVDCAARSHKINPLVYGIAFYAPDDGRDTHQFSMGASARRWGGNYTSRYNWERNAFNAGSDWYFRNLNYLGPGESWETFLETNAKKGMQTALTLPMLGWVAKDTTSVSFPIDRFPNPQDAEWQWKAGNGKGRDGKEFKPLPPNQTSVAAPPEFVAKWVRAIAAKEKKSGRKLVHQYILDNEPMLWNSTHRDVHPEPLSYDALLERTIKYATAIRQADPQAVIAGPAEWGWSNYFYSAVDLKSFDGPAGKPDHRAHGGVPLAAWYLRKLREHEQKTGVKLLDVFDLHFYPQAGGVGIATQGDTSPDGAARRLRTTRALWDKSYVDESWIAEAVELIPRMRRWVDENYPGLGLSIGEWNFGAEGHISGGLAVAEALGRFGQNNLHSAFYWAYPPANSPAFWAFRAYRNYDGRGATFPDWSVGTRAPEASSLFAATDEQGTRLVAVALNLDPERSLDATFELAQCGEVQKRRIFTYSGTEPAGLTEAKGFSGDRVAFKPYSLTVVEWILSKKR